MALPDVDIKFKSVFTNEYVRPTADHAYLSANEKDHKNPIVQSRLEKARDGMWCIKCLPTGKYWQVKPGNSLWITRDGDAGSEDALLSIEWFDCGPTTTIRFRHHKLNHYACVDITSEIPPPILHHYRLRESSENTNKDSKDVFVYSKF